MAATGDTQPNPFAGSYFVCSGGKDSFVVTYSGRNQDAATVNTNINKSYNLHRTPVTTGKMFEGQGVKFWTDGKTVVLTGAQQTYTACRQQG